MSIHLRLPAPEQLENGKPSQGRTPPPVNRGAAARTLRGILEGLESAPGFFTRPAQSEDEPVDDDVRELGRIVLKFTGKKPFANSGLGQWPDALVKLGFTEDYTYFAISDQASRDYFRQLVQDYAANIAAPEEVDFAHPKAWRDALENLEDVAIYDRADRLTPGLVLPEPDELKTFDIVLWPTSVLADRDALRQAQGRIDEVVEVVTSGAKRGAVVQVADATRPDSLLVRAVLDQETAEAILDHPFVEVLRQPIRAKLTMRDLTNARRPAHEIIAGGAAIGVIDDLVQDNNPWMEGVVADWRSFPSPDAFGDASTHGTQVASIAAWGNVADLLKGDPKHQPNTIYAARVAHLDADDQVVLAGEPATQLRAAIEWFASNNVRIVVFPYTYAYPDAGALASELSSVIDELAAKHDMVIIVSAGNVTDLPEGEHWKEHFPRYLRSEHSRIAAPGTAALALTVGSVTHGDHLDTERFPNGVTISRKGEPSPFSRTGSTAKNATRKPEVSGHGGSWGWDSTTNQVIENDVNQAVVTLRPANAGRLFSVAWGTSYAAPHVAFEVSRIAHRYPTASANLLRALTSLSAERTDPYTTHVHGHYGVPNAERVRESGPNRVIVYHEGVIKRDSYQLIKLPIPEEFATGVWHRDLNISLAFDPPVRRSRRRYIGGSMTFDFYRNHTDEQLREIYRTQPDAEQVAAGAVVHGVPGHDHNRPDLRPNVNALRSDTLINRSFRLPGGWNPDDTNYTLVLTHTSSPWSESQKNATPFQKYAIAIELVDRDNHGLDLYALTSARLDAINAAQARAGARGRAGR